VIWLVAWSRGCRCATLNWRTRGNSGSSLRLDGRPGIAGDVLLALLLLYGASCECLVVRARVEDRVQVAGLLFEAVIGILNQGLNSEDSKL